MLDLCPMLRNFNSLKRHIDYLPLLVAGRFYFSQRSKSVTSLSYSMNLDVIRMLHCFQGMPAVSRSTTTFPAVAFTQTLERRFVLS
jgi:hypothetical protein